MKFRVPEWSDASRMELTVNGTAQPVSASGGYVAVSRKWADGDEVRLTLPMSLQRVHFARRFGQLFFHVRSSGIGFAHGETGTGRFVCR